MSYHSNPTYTTKAPPKKLQIILVNAIHNNKAYLLEVSYWLTIAELKRQIEKAFAVPMAQQRLIFQGQELKENKFSLSQFGGRKKIKLILRPTPQLENTLGLIKKYETLPQSESVDSMLFSAQEGFNLGLIPKLTFNGTSGSYFLRNRYRKTIGIFKPFDEEPFAPNNPKDYKGKLGMQGFKRGILSGESAIREVSAYLLDRKGFSGVPATTFVEVLHPYFSNRDMKESEITETQENPMIPISNYSQYTDPHKKLLIKHGSLQKFVEDAEEAGDFSSKLFPASYYSCYREVRKIAILDLRILNCDRNEGNILVRKNRHEFTLIPIDHGLTFPDCFEASTYDVVWMEWDQIKGNWTPEELEYIKNIDPKADVEILCKHFKFREICLRNFRIAETVLKKCALTGLSLFDIGSIMYREDPDLPSPIEELIRKTQELHATMTSSEAKEVLVAVTKTEKKKKVRSKIDLSNEESKRDGGCIEKGEEVIDSKTFLDRLNGKDEASFKGTGRQSLKQEGKENETGLFTIPEVGVVPSNESPAARKLSNTHKDSFSKNLAEIDESKETESLGESSSEDEDKENSYENKKGKKPRRASSIPSKMRRKLSSGEGTKAKEEDEFDKKEEGECHEKKKNHSHHKDKKDRKIKPHKDELFFRYFEWFLDQKIETLIKAKQPKQNRGRFMSEL